ncbi:MAG: ion channel DMI1 [Myxococcota bacterium]|nr:ion channel DMI1 [Myxococcota bacterium]
MLRGLPYRLLLAASIVVLVSLLAGALLALLDARSSDLGENVWWAFLRLTDPGYLGDDEGVARRTISTVVTVLGYVLFLGLLIAILTQWLNGLISGLQSGVTPIALSDHVIVLGWTHRTPTIVAELLGTGGRVRRFLARRGANDLRIVVLAEQVDEALLRELRERVGTPWSDRRVFLRSGSPLRIDHLERVAFRDAAVLILPGADFGEHRPEVVDTETIKTLMAVSRHASAEHAEVPLAVAEIFDGRRAAVARRAYAGPSEILATDEIVSRLIVQSVQQQGMCDVFQELLTLGVGNALFVRQLDDLAGRRFGELCGAFSRAIPLGTVRPGQARPALAPDPETVLDAEDQLVFIARRFEDCLPDATPSAGGAVPPSPATRSEPAGRRILILGWSRKVPALLEELARVREGAYAVDVVSSTPGPEREAALVRRGATLDGIALQQIEAGYTDPGVLERLEPARYDNIVLLASERLDHEEQADANTVYTYLLLRGLLAAASPSPRLFVELLDAQNEFLFAREDSDRIVSPLLVSYLLSQVALRRELGAVVAELSSSAGAQIALRPARAYLAAGEPARFADLGRAAAARGEIALGVRRAAGAGAELELNPDRETAWVPEDGDEVVVLTTDAD